MGYNMPEQLRQFYGKAAVAKERDNLLTIIFEKYYLKSIS